MEPDREFAGPASPVGDVRLVAGVVLDDRLDLVGQGSHRGEDERPDKEDETKCHDADRHAPPDATTNQEDQDRVQPDGDEEGEPDDDEDTRNVRQAAHEEVRHRDAEGA